MALDDLGDTTDREQAQESVSNVEPPDGDTVGAALESIIQDCFDDLDADNGKSFTVEDGKVVADRDELVEDVMLMCAMTAKKVNE